MMTTVGAQRLNPCFARYQQGYPNIEFELVIDNDQSLLEKLEPGQLDLAITPAELTLRSAYQTKLLYTERYVVAFTKAHRFNQLDSIDLKDIPNRTLFRPLELRVTREFKGDLPKSGNQLVCRLPLQ